MTDLIDTIADERAALVFAHELVAIDAYGVTCSCGADVPSWLEHLGAVALAAFDLEPPVGPDRPMDRMPTFAEGAVVARRVLADLQARHERKWAALEATGLTGFSERMDWLRANRSRMEKRADLLRQREMQEAVLSVACASQYPPSMGGVMEGTAA